MYKSHYLFSPAAFYVLHAVQEVDRCHSPLPGGLQLTDDNSLAATGSNAQLPPTTQHRAGFAITAYELRFGRIYLQHGAFAVGCYERCPRPGCGLSPRMKLRTASAGFFQSIMHVSLNIFGAA